MPYLLALVAILMIQSNVYAENKDSLVLKFNTYKVYQDTETAQYTIKNQVGIKIHQNLMFVGSMSGRANGYLQVLDSKGEIFYLDETGKKLENARVLLGLCGTVPHYTLTIKKEVDSFYVYEDETFYDSGNKIPAEKIITIPTSDADALYFVNMEESFSFTQNYGLGDFKSYPRSVAFKKGDLYGIWGHDAIAQYDSIKSLDGLWMAEKEGLYCYPEISKAAKYTHLAPFQNHLAAFELPDGQKGFIDKRGKEYLILK